MMGNSERSEGLKAEREKRLAEALRANLKRRKAQARKRSATADAAPRNEARNERESG